MAMNFLEFEQPIAELEAKIEELKFLGTDSSVNISEEIKRLQALEKAHALLQQEHDLLKKAIRFCSARRQKRSPSSTHSRATRRST